MLILTFPSYTDKALPYHPESMLFHPYDGEQSQYVTVCTPIGGDGKKIPRKGFKKVKITQSAIICLSHTKEHALIFLTFKCCPQPSYSPGVVKKLVE
jgi:hypothetical protein